MVDHAGARLRGAGVRAAAASLRERLRAVRGPLRRRLRAIRLELGRLRRFVRGRPANPEEPGGSVRVHAPGTPGFGVGSPVDLLLCFADGPDNLYQLRQWLPVLHELAADRRVAVLCRNARAYVALVEETSLPVLYVRYLRDLEAIYLASDVKVCLYVNNHHLNFQSLTFADQLHVHLNHGESEKISMASNQAKAYDYVVVAGAAARERYEQHLLHPEHARLVELGRPQLDLLPAHRPRADGRTSVLYAPTWEGGRDHMDYTSVAELGVAIVRALLDAGFAVVYRPHPKTGSRRGDVAEAHRRILALLDAATDGGHRVSADEPLGEALADADVLVADVSSVLLDFLPTGRPILVTRPATAAGARIAATSEVTSVGVPLAAADVPQIAALVRDALADDAGAQARGRLAHRFFGDLSPGASTRRFATWLDGIVVERDALVAAKRDRIAPRATDLAG